MSIISRNALVKLPFMMLKGTIYFSNYFSISRAGRKGGRKGMRGYEVADKDELKRES